MATQRAQVCLGTLQAHFDLAHCGYLSHPLVSTTKADRGKKEQGEARGLVGYWREALTPLRSNTFDCNRLTVGIKKNRYFISDRISFLEALITLWR